MPPTLQSCSNEENVDVALARPPVGLLVASTVCHDDVPQQDEEAGRSASAREVNPRYVIQMSTARPTFGRPVAQQLLADIRNGRLSGLEVADRERWRAASEPETRAVGDIAEALADYASGNHQEAAEKLEALTLSRPDFADAAYLLALVRRTIGSSKAALEELLGLCQREPQAWHPRAALADLLEEQALLEVAEGYYREALLLDPSVHELWLKLWRILQRRSRTSAIEPICRTVLAQHPNCLLALYNLAENVLSRGELAEAAELFRRYLAEAPNSVHPAYRLAEISNFLERGDAAQDWWSSALSQPMPLLRQARAHMGIAMACLVARDFKRGWKEYEWRLEFYGHKTPEGPIQRWTGEAIDGKSLLVLCEQGYEDIIQFVRYLPYLPRGVRAQAVVPDGLLPLVKSLDADVSLIPASSALPTADYYCYLLSLPHLLGDSAIPPAPYLRVDPTYRAKWSPRVAGLAGLKVGLVWAGNPGYRADGARSMRLRQFDILADVEGVSFVSLQMGDAAAETVDLDLKLRLTDWTWDIHDYADTAALIEQLDLLIAVDTSVIHLAGAIGHPAWMLNRRAPHWAWLLKGDENPWYSSVRQFRQVVYHQWDEPLAAVRAALMDLISGTSD